MSIFDYIAPEIAQATHMRRLADSVAQAQAQSRIQRARTNHMERSTSARIKELESEVGQLTIITEALLECLESEGVVTKLSLASKIGEIDARDGVIDGRITKDDRKDPSLPEVRKLHIPES